MSKLLADYIKLAVAEAARAGVPQQLLSDQESGTRAEEMGDEKMDEFSGVGAIAGYTAPLGASPDDMGRRKNAKKR